MFTKSDHKIVIAEAQIKWRIPRSKICKEKKVDIKKFSDEEYRNRYSEALAKKLADTPKGESNQESWSKLAEAIKESAVETMGYVAKKASNDVIKELSEEQQHLHNLINSTTDKSKRKTLQTQRNKVMTEIHNAVKKQEAESIENVLSDLVQKPNDSRKMFEAVKNLQRITPSKPLLVKTECGLTANDEQQAKIIASHFKQQFFRNATPLPNIQPGEMRIPFTAEEVKKASSTLKNNKSPGCDGIIAEMIKYGPDELFERISNIYNSVSSNGEIPEELIHGILRALQKPGKSKGPVEHLRPIILLSILRKILAICMMNRIGGRLDAEIPLSQAAYRKGRSTTEHVFAVKLVAERTITSSSEVVYLTLHDMSKAFDTIDRNALIHDLSDVVEKDELNIIKLLLGVKLTVKCGNSTSETFVTDTGAPQGDCMSANEFTYYLSKTLYGNEEVNIPTVSTPSNHFTMNLEYADDMTDMTTNGEHSKFLKTSLPVKLDRRNLTVNVGKTEEFVIDKQHHDWKKCKLLGSLLDTEEDIKRRKGLAIDALNKIKFIIDNNKLPLRSKLLAFDAYVASIFLYNSEIWTITKRLENQIDVFHRKIIKEKIMKIFYPKVISNEEFYKRTKCTPWSVIVEKRRLKWFGHLMRLPPDTPARKALEYATAQYAKPRGRPKMTWLAMFKKQLSDGYGLSWERACALASDRDVWKRYI